ncbi:hypothetical protein O7635_32605 [Asanoa sp. WMMD1127]|uniref:hypothetical protein n=1 Tax=Asanoa sp. WMMD1127 TaxID=3016107 RepID=UPI002416F2A2|nr:hypothetical protein [Asanoa sp. WMMD1127]MDG4826616.1 hypothetical protein [Asanoa sp. WMMD1127]
MRRALAAAAALTLTLVTAACAGSKPEPAPGTAHTASSTSPELATALGKARASTAKYVTDLPAAQAAGYQVITPMMPGMGYHYLNPEVTDFDVTTPAILVYVRNGDAWQLGALEWVWPEQPAAPPLPGATYGSFDAACHYADGTFVPTEQEADCAKTNGAAAFGFWHPKLVTMHVWLWYHNPDGLYHPTNPLVPAA